MPVRVGLVFFDKTVKILEDHANRLYVSNQPWQTS